MSKQQSIQILIVLLRQKYKAPLSIKSPELRTKGNVDIRGGNYSKGLNKQDVNLTDRLLAIDLVFLAPGVYNALKTYRTRKDLHYRSDHIPVYIELEQEQKKQTKPQRRAQKSLENKKTAKKIKERGGRLARILGLPPLETTEAVNEYLGQILDSFQEIIE